MIDNFTVTYGDACAFETGKTFGIWPPQSAGDAKTLTYNGSTVTLTLLMSAPFTYGIPCTLSITAEDSNRVALDP